MKKLCAALVCLMTSTAFAVPANSHLPKSMKLSASTLKLAKPVKAQLGCDLYEFDKDWNATFLKSANTPMVDFGSSTILSVEFPAPYQNYSVHFEHQTVSFAIDNFSTARPFIQSYLARTKADGTDILSVKDATFAIDNASTGSKITLDNLYSYNDNVWLYSLCLINFIKA